APRPRATGSASVAPRSGLSGPTRAPACAARAAETAETAGAGAREARHAGHLAGQGGVVDADAGAALGALRLDHDRVPDAAALGTASTLGDSVRTLDRCEGDAMALESASLREKRSREHDGD